MQEPFKFCSVCRAQNNLSAQFCQQCGAQYGWAPPQWAAPARPKRTGPFKLLVTLFAVVFGCCIVSGIIGSLRNKTTPSTGVTLTSSPAPTISASASIAADGAERMVLDNAQVTVYVECTHQEWKRYKFRFIVKKPGSPLLAPILRQAGNPRAYSVFVNGVDTGDDFAFSPNIAAFDNNGDLIPATFVSRPLNGNVALGYAYHDLVVKYEKGN